MKTIIAGSRTYTRYDHLRMELDSMSLWQITEVVSGGAPGADRLGERWAKSNGIKVTVMPADWKKHGKAAGPIRNAAMAEYAEALIAFWDGKSPGTRDMIQKARAKGLKVMVVRSRVEARGRVIHG